jgi:hypothetical protein
LPAKRKAPAIDRGFLYSLVLFYRNEGNSWDTFKWLNSFCYVQVRKIGGLTSFTGDKTWATYRFGRSLCLGFPKKLRHKPDISLAGLNEMEVAMGETKEQRLS